MNSARKLASAGLALVLLAAVSTPVLAQLGLTRRDGYFTITWNVDRSNPNEIAIIGEVYNGHDLMASDVRLRVTGVDVRGRMVSRAVGSVDSQISPAGMSFFEIRLRPVGVEVSFLVAVEQFEFRGSEAP